MLDAFKAAGAVANLFRNREQLAAAVTRVKSSLEGKKVTGDGGGGSVKVTMNGRMRVLEMQIDPKLLAEKDQNLMRQIITDAVNKAIAKAQEQVSKEVTVEMKNLGLPEIPGLSLK